MTNYSNIHNDFALLDKHVIQLQNVRDKMSQTHKMMEQKIEELNEAEFKDGNFENLYSVFMKNVENIRSIERKLLECEEYSNGLSQIIKDYYSVPI